MKRTDDHSSSTQLLVGGLTPPTDRESAAEKMDALVDHINRIKSGGHPAPLHVAFMLPYFWALEQPHEWPVFWTSSRDFLEVTTGSKFSGSPAERYLRFLELVDDLDGDYLRLARVTSWWGEKRPVFLDPVLVDRCAYGIHNRNEESIEGLKSNADAMVAVAGYLGRALVEDLSEAAGHQLRPWRLPALWTAGGWGRPDLWVDWKVEGAEKLETRAATVDKS